MQIFDELEKLNELPQPIVLTIGNFDGVHLGHQAILKRMKSLAKSSGTIIIISFPIHPSTIIHLQSPVELICTTKHKIKLFKDHDIDVLLHLSFTKEFANQSPEDFLKTVKDAIPFTHLILGYDAAIGKNRKGTPEEILRLSKMLHFHVEYIPSVSVDDSPISSTRLRHLIASGKLAEVGILLGRPYSIYGEVISGSGRGKYLGYQTANIDLTGLRTPPYGVYAVQVYHHDSIYRAIANIGVAPTMNHLRSPTLEVHLLDTDINLYGKDVEVVFHQFIRPEIRFNHPEELKAQIAKDIVQVRKLLL